MSPVSAADWASSRNQSHENLIPGNEHHCLDVGCRSKLAAFQARKYRVFRRSIAPVRVYAGKCYCLPSKMRQRDFAVLKSAFAAIPMTLLVQCASATEIAGAGALALAAIVAAHDPALTPTKRNVMAKLFAEHKAPYPAGHKVI